MKGRNKVKCKIWLGNQMQKNAKISSYSWKNVCEPFKKVLLRITMWGFWSFFKVVFLVVKKQTDDLLKY